MKQETTINELMDFLQENIPTKDDLKNELRNFATKDDLRREIDGIDARLDGIDARLDRVDARLLGIDARLDRVDARLLGIEGELVDIKDKLKRMGKMLTEDYNAAAEDAVKLKKRVKILEQRVAQIQGAH